MKLIFDSATEYFEFLEMQQRAFGQPFRLVDSDIYAETAERLKDPMVDAQFDQKPDVTDPEEAAKNTGGVPSGQDADKPKRTRKPKAPDAVMAEQPPKAWPFGAPGEGQAVQQDQPQQTEQPAPVTIQAPTAEQKAEFAADAAKHAGQIDPAKLAERVATLGVVDPAKHLTAARMFIARHQLPAYHQVQRDAGLPDDIISYTDEQRTTHMAAMELFNEAQPG